MAIPQHLLETAAQHRREGRRTGLVVRHAERYDVHDLSTHELVLLTERGHAQAREGGARLAKLSASVKVLHSPVERCAETARGLAAGMSSAGARADVVGESAALYSPFILDRQRAWEIVSQKGYGFMRAWFDGQLPHDVFQPRAHAAQGQLDAMARAMAEHDHDVVTVFVSHDWNIALIREDVLGVKPEETWPGFLDGVVVSLDQSEIVVELDGRVGRRPAPVFSSSSPSPSSSGPKRA